jgi:hypothetical protein
MQVGLARVPGISDATQRLARDDRITSANRHTAHAHVAEEHPHTAAAYHYVISFHPPPVHRWRAHLRHAVDGPEDGSRTRSVYRLSEDLVRHGIARQDTTSPKAKGIEFLDVDAIALAAPRAKTRTSERLEMRVDQLVSTTIHYQEGAAAERERELYRSRRGTPPAVHPKEQHSARGRGNSQG